MPTSRLAPPRETKAAILRKLLARKNGADLTDLQLATDWQPHSVRAGLSGLKKAGYTIDRADAAKPGGTSAYRITGGPDGAR